MTHKFKVGDKVKVTLESGSKLEGVIAFESLGDIDCKNTDIWDVRIGNIFVHVHEDGLEKIEEPAKIPPTYKVGDKVSFCDTNLSKVSTGSVMNIRYLKEETYQYLISHTLPKSPHALIELRQEWVEQVYVICLYEEPKPKYKVGDRVIFFFLDEGVKIGHIEKINPLDTYKVCCGNYYYLLNDKDILARSNIMQTQKVAQEEFKEGDEVWVRGTISLHDDGTLVDRDGDIEVGLVSTRGGYDYFNRSQIFKSIPPKNDWVSVKDRLPPENEVVQIITKLKAYYSAKLSTEFSRGWIKYVFEVNNLPSWTIDLKIVTHWKPLDAPPSE